MRRGLIKYHFCNKPEETVKSLQRSKPSPSQEEDQNGSVQGDHHCWRWEHTDSESTGLVLQHALSANSGGHDQWILDSGATCHMCNYETMFSNFRTLPSPLNVTFGDGRNVLAVGCGNIVLTKNLPQGEIESCTLSQCSPGTWPCIQPSQCNLCF